MRYKRKLLFLCVSLILILMILSGCSKSGKSEEDIIKDLQASPVFISADVEISDYEIIKRQTDAKNKTDVIYITVHTNAPELTSSLTYKLEYELYNEGWILESVMRSHDGPWEFSGISNEQILADIRENDYYFSDWGLNGESIDIVEETCDSNAMVYYEKRIAVNLTAHNTLFDYYSSYNMCYGVVGGNWELQSAEIQNQRYTPTYSPNIAATDDIMNGLKLGNLYEIDYDSYEYLKSEKDWNNCFEMRYYEAKKSWDFGTETYLVSVPLKFSLENGEDSSKWTYNSEEIESSLQSVDWNICGEWTCDYRGDPSKSYAIVDLHLYEIKSTEDPKKFAVTLSCDAKSEKYDCYCNTHGDAEGYMIQSEPGLYFLYIENSDGTWGVYPWRGIFDLCGFSSNSYKQGLRWCTSDLSDNYPQLQRVS